MDGRRGISIAWLSLVTVAYLALPWVIFAAGMLRWSVALWVMVTVIVPVVVMARRVIRLPDELGTLSLSGKQVGLLVVIALAWLAQSGVGYVGFQREDYYKHNAVLRDLIELDWPIVYQAFPPDGSPAGLMYYTAWYLPPAAIGKIAAVFTSVSTGWYVANAMMFVWTAIGVVMTLMWFSHLVGRRPIVSALAFVWMGGLGAIGQPILNGLLGLDSGFGDWWAQGFTYASNMFSMVWSPQHALSNWLATFLIFDRLERVGDLRDTGYIAALCALWSPFAVVGLAPLWLYGAFLHRGRGVVGGSNLLAGPLLLLLAAIYFSSNHQLDSMRGWIWQVHEYGHWPVRMFALWLFECGLFVGAVWWLESTRKKPQRREWGWLIVIAILLALIPFYSVGRYNDFAMRVSMPALLVMRLLIVRSVCRPTGLRSARWLLIGLILISVAIPARSVFRSIMRYRFGPQMMITVRQTPRLPDTYVLQYRGELDHFFFTHLARHHESLRELQQRFLNTPPPSHPPSPPPSRVIQ